MKPTRSLFLVPDEPDDFIASRGDWFARAHNGPWVNPSQRSERQVIYNWRGR